MTTAGHCGAVPARFRRHTVYWWDRPNIPAALNESSNGPSPFNPAFSFAAPGTATFCT